MIDFNIIEFNFKDRNDLFIKENEGIVKCKKIFPIYNIDGKKYLFKPLSKTKPWTTPLFGISEVFWSYIIKKYFDSKTPIYQLAKCCGYSDIYPSKYDVGVLVESITSENEQLINLLEYFNHNPDRQVDIQNYINYCGIYYDYTSIFESEIFKNNLLLSEELAKQVLISILKNDLNYHYENVAFIYQDNKIISLQPPIDHEFSLYFLFPDMNYLFDSYFGAYCQTLIGNFTDESIKSDFIIKNINYIKIYFPKIFKEFLINLKKFIKEFMSYDFLIPSDYMSPFSTNLFEVYESIYKEHSKSKALSEIEKFRLYSLNTQMYSKIIKHDILSGSKILCKSLETDFFTKKNNN